MMTIGKTRIAKALTRREFVAGVHAGASGLPWETYEERIRSATLDAPEAATGRGQSSAKNAVDAKAPRAKVIAAEVAEVARRREEIDGELSEARPKHQTLKKEFPALLAKRPASSNAGFWVTIAIVLLLGDWAFTLQALADAAGVDLQAGWDSIPLFLVCIVVVTSVLAVLANAWAGIKATDKEHTLRRLFGFAMLALCGIILAGLRGAASAESSTALALFGLIIPAIGGLTAGEAHHRVEPYFKALGQFKTELKARKKELDDAEARVAELEQALAEVEERRRALAVESEQLALEPEMRAQGEEEKRRILAARLAAARYAYDLGATMGGSKRNGLSKEGSDA